MLIAAVPSLRERRPRYQEAQMRRHEEELRRYEERQNAFRDRNRLRGLLELARRAKEAQTAREFLDALAVQTGDGMASIGDRTLTNWIAWARDRLTAHDPLQAGAAAIFRPSRLSSIDHFARGRNFRIEIGTNQHYDRSDPLLQNQPDAGSE